MNEYIDDVTYEFQGFYCGKLLGDGCKAWIDDNVSTAFDGVVYLKGKLRTVYKTLKPHTCRICGKVSNQIYRNYQMNETTKITGCRIQGRR